ncbi:histidine kinase [Yinghuangia sp. ASG 101]|uniref:sensor histidine kinase n=1 Tax=Yinghuangia sp. ASG 101 TaxID=2896848 RepID=UPI001E594CB2|nr:histidine kinase [Yinghuangia sp. ASG 101]UGQ09180.1 histidine kinase [Yinghuangia sp. ASG 101]
MQGIYEWLRRHPFAVDATGASLLLMVGLIVSAVEDGGRRAVASGLIALLLCASMAVRRVHLRAAAAGVVLAGVLQLATGVLPAPVDLAIIVVLHTAAKSGPMWLSRLGLALAFVAPVLMVLRFPPEPAGFKQGAFGCAFVVFMLLIAWVLGDSMRTRRAYYAELEDRAARLERERDAHAEVAAAAERARIARELHDVVAHNVSVMVVQADGAAYTMDAAPERARDALGTIARTGREALAEMRRLLGVLRSDADRGPYVPQPGVEQLGDLVDRVRDAGLAVDLRITGVPVELPKGVALASYRIVQEALTNTRKHAGPSATASVVLGYGEDALVVAITDDGRGADAPGDGMGHGLVGMRERVAMLGGRLETGPADEGGWRVRVVLPYGAEAGMGAAPSRPARERAPDRAPGVRLTSPARPTPAASPVRRAT